MLGLQGQDGIPGALCPAEGRAGVACGIDMLRQVPSSYKFCLLICKAAAPEGFCGEPRKGVQVERRAQLLSEQGLV